MFFSYLMNNIKHFMLVWFFLTLANQALFFGSCLRPDCILASIPHVSLLSLLAFYVVFKSKNQTFDTATGLNEFGFDENGRDKSGYDRDGYDPEGYDTNGYNKEGYDRDGYDKHGIDANGQDRKQRGVYKRFFNLDGENDNLAKMHKEKVQSNIEGQKARAQHYRIERFVARAAPRIHEQVAKSMGISPERLRDLQNCAK